MPSINRIRVNNVKYNFGTQEYDDFSMRMYGRNTLYDLANGGGKSVLMLLLMQNLIPNSTLDDKQPIEKLFRDASNTVIHSLIEWKLDPCDVKEGMRFMTTGFAAKKAATTEEDGEGGTAQIEYFNYVIFYRDYNKNDIINLPLEKDGERVSYKGLRNYLHDLSRNDKNIIVQVFDRKGEYQRFIADYGLYESHWEIIRGINKTEGHVRTYFETNYKTTRKVIEDLLIEEIIEKAYQTKTERDAGKTESTVSLLMTIQEELKTLAEKKKGIQMYDHEMELIDLIVGRVNSFMNLYEKQDEVATDCGRVYVTLEAEKQSREAKKQELADGVAEAQRALGQAMELVEILKIYRELENYREKEDRAKALDAERSRLGEETRRCAEETAGMQAEIEYLELRRAENELEALKREKEGSRDTEQGIYAIVANIRKRLDKKLAEIAARLQPVEAELEAENASLSSLEKQRLEAETEYAVQGSRLEYTEAELKELGKSVDELRDDIEYSLMIDPASSVRDRADRLAAAEQKVKDLDEKRAAKERERLELSRSNDEKSFELRRFEDRAKELRNKVEEFSKLKDKYTSISTIYAGGNNARPEVVVDNLRERISSSVIGIHELELAVEKLEKREQEIRNGKLITETEGVKKVIDYLFTRHSSDAMYGMDYLTALPEDMRKRLLKKNPGLPYGVVVRGLSSLLDDQGLKEQELDEEVMLYDRDALDGVTVMLGDGVHCVRRDAEYFTDPKMLDSKLHILGGELDNKREELRSSRMMLETLNEDMDFVRELVDKDYLTAPAELEASEQEIQNLEAEIDTIQSKLSKLGAELEGIAEEEEKTSKNISKFQNELILLNKLVSVQDREDALIKEKDHIVSAKRRIGERLEALTAERSSIEMKKVQLASRRDGLARERDELGYKWENKYSAYYVESGQYPDIDMDDAGLESAFDRALGGSEGRISMEKEKLLMDTLASSIDRSLRTINELGVDINALRAKEGEMVSVSPDVVDTMKRKLEELKAQKEKAEQSRISLLNEMAKLEGSIEYARTRLVGEYGEGALSHLDNLEEEYTADVARSLQKADAIYNERKFALDKARTEEAKYLSAAKGNDDLMKLAGRIVDTGEIDTSGLEPLESAEGIREIFETKLVEYDRLTKELERAKADTMRVKMRVYETLSEMNALELAASVRDDVNVPGNKKAAEELLQRLNNVIEIIRLERDRVERSLVSMEQLKDNFVDQCVERCLDVKSELDKLTRLSEITMDGEKVQMIRLGIPYVKDEFIKARMSDYIDHIVEEVDKKDTDAERQKLLNTSLAMKRLFSVIVTDMSKIRLQLYKRERIKEQSRYLRYEEAVGSTGQSQGIYIQFLISIINYISGMYAVSESAGRSKTLFIDNPFGAAKDIYIWEPIFKLLEENSCQLIVPARGATPEITGRFDINYVLGQQMRGNRTTTVVVNYSSKTKGEDLEYKALDYEQATFDFV